MGGSWDPWRPPTRSWPAKLRPAPAAWVQAAIELPTLRRIVDDLAALAEADAEVRAAMLADLEAAVRERGVAPTPRLIADLRERLT